MSENLYDYVRVDVSLYIIIMAERTEFCQNVCRTKFEDVETKYCVANWCSLDSQVGVQLG